MHTPPDFAEIERYTLVEKVGEGALSKVYRAKDNTGEYDEVAIKVVEKALLSAKQRANVLKEVQIMRQLDHPSILGVLDFAESKQHYFIVLEMCAGGDIFQQIVRLTYFSEDLCRHIIFQVAKGLEYLHQKAGVAHRDIKPENLLFYPAPFFPKKSTEPSKAQDEDKVEEGEFVPGVGSGQIGLVKIADFGLSKIIWESQTVTPCGTIGYSAPEVVKSERYSNSVDMWALGCVLYSLLCGFPPFYDDDIRVMTRKISTGQYTFVSPWWDEVSPSARDLISNLLTVDPEKRYDITQVLDHPWMQPSMKTTSIAA